MILSKNILNIYILVFILCLGLGINAQVPKDTLQMIKVLYLDGKNHIKSNEYQEGILSYFNAYKLASNSAYKEEAQKIRYSIIELNYYLQNFEKAKTEAINLLAELKEEKNDLLYNELKYLLAYIYIQTEDFENSKKNLQEAEVFFNSINDNKNLAHILFGYGLIEQKQNKNTAAINYYEAALPIFKKHELNYQIAFTELNKAQCYLNAGNILPNSLDKAKTALSNSISISKKNSYSKLKIDALKLESYIALKENNFLLAEEKLSLFEKQNDSLYKVFFNAISRGVDVETDLLKFQEIIDQQQLDIEAQKKSISFGKMTTGLSIALIVILSLLTLSLYKNNNLRAKANNLLRDKNIELELAKEKTEKASLAKAQFLSTITHELRTPLYAVTGLTHLLLEENPTPEQKEHLNSLKFSGEYLLSLINNILDINKLEANRVEIEKTTFNLRKRINDVLVSLKKTAEDKNNTLHLDFDESISKKIIGDPIKLSQILINLVSNALKFTQNGEVYIRVKKIKDLEDRIHLHFEVEDTGVGISKKKQKSVFESFSQASLQINRKFGGTGLGLAIVKNLLELMGSKIELESTLGKGSKFWFDIKFMVAEDQLIDSINPKTQEIDFNLFRNKKVLVVEDNKINQMITRKILEKERMICTVADNGVDAINLTKKQEFDVILMDIHMPGISGIEATIDIRKTNTNIPILALTAVTIDENLDDFYRAGFTEIIPKPFKTEEFFEKIYKSLQKNKEIQQI